MSRPPHQARDGAEFIALSHERERQRNNPPLYDWGIMISLVESFIWLRNKVERMEEEREP